MITLGSGAISGMLFSSRFLVNLALSRASEGQAWVEVHDTEPMHNLHTTGLEQCSYRKEGPSHCEGSSGASAFSHCPLGENPVGLLVTVFTPQYPHVHVCPWGSGISDILVICVVFCWNCTCSLSLLQHWLLGIFCITGMVRLSLALCCEEYFWVCGLFLQLSTFFLILFWPQEEPAISCLSSGLAVTYRIVLFTLTCCTYLLKRLDFIHLVFNPSGILF